jgi:hypothetical protein
MNYFKGLLTKASTNPAVLVDTPAMDRTPAGISSTYTLGLKYSAVIDVSIGLSIRSQPSFAREYVTVPSAKLLLVTQPLFSR